MEPVGPVFRLATDVLTDVRGPAGGGSIALKRRLVSLLRRTYALSLAARDERTPRAARVVALVALAWVVFPLDFDFVPILGWVDDAVVVTLGSGLVRRLTPAPLYSEFEDRSPKHLRRVFVVVGLFVAALVAVFAYLVWQTVLA